VIRFVAGAFVGFLAAMCVAVGYSSIHRFGD
jgi:hypothetical protein